jgi:hypothetical protein
MKLTAEQEALVKRIKEAKSVRDLADVLEDLVTRMVPQRLYLTPPEAVKNARVNKIDPITGEDIGHATYCRASMPDIIEKVPHAQDIFVSIVTGEKMRVIFPG